MNIRIATISVLSLLLLSACSITVGMTDGTTESFQNTTESASDFSDASTGSTSSTSPKFGSDSSDSDALEEEASRRMQNAYAFIKPNYSRVKIDASRGSGEYLQAVAESLEIPSMQRPEFYKKTQKEFDRLFVKNKDPISLVKNLYHIAYST